MFTLPSIKTIETSALTLFVALVGFIFWAFINVNFRQLATAKGWDVYFLKVWDAIPEWGHKVLAGWAPLRQIWWLWLSLGLSGGLGIALWLLASEQMETAPIRTDLDSAKQQVSSLQSQLEAKTRILDAAEHKLRDTPSGFPPIDVLTGQQNNLFMSLGEIFGEMRVHQSELSAAANEISKANSGPNPLPFRNFYYVLPCRIIVSSTKENQTFAKFIETIAQSQQCQAQDAPSPAPPPRPTDADEPPPKPIVIPDPLPYIIVRYPRPEDVQNLLELPSSLGVHRLGSTPIPSQEINEKTAKFRDQIADRLLVALQRCGLDARRSHKAEGSPGWAVDKWTIYIDLGKTQMCR
jgi:hypothetical protein